MGRTTKQLSGGGKDKFLRRLIAGEASIAAEAAERLGDAMCDAIADVRVRRDAWQPGHESGTTKASTVERPAAGSAPPPAFDPFVFSALAVLTKQGAAALAEKLGGIAGPDQLHALARAQHLAVDAGLSDGPALRAAIVRATEARLAERRAAAS